VKFKASSEIVVPNEEASIVLVRKAKRSELLRVTIELNREALQELPDEELAKFGIVRKAKENLIAAFYVQAEAAQKKRNEAHLQNPS